MACEVEGCDKLHEARGMCNLHYLRWRRLQKLRSQQAEFEKTCTKCSVTKSSTAFSSHAATKDGLRPDCSECHAAYHRDLRAKNSRDFYRPNERVKNYGIDAQEFYDGLLAKQNGKCAICDVSESEVTGRFRVLCIDHDHKTGRIRGLLCTSCNKGLGHFRDDPRRLIEAAKYLQKI